MKETKLERCGDCGEFQDNPKFYTKKQQDNYQLIHCGCILQQEQRFVTRDMAIDAGDLSLEGQIY